MLNHLTHKHLDNIVREWSYNVDNGMPDASNPIHCIKLKETLNEMGYPKKFAEILLGKLREMEKTDFPAVTKKGRTTYFGTDDTRKAAIKKGTHYKVGSPEAKAAELGIDGDKSIDKEKEAKQKEKERKKQEKLERETEAKKPIFKKIVKLLFIFQIGHLVILDRELDLKLSLAHLRQQKI